MKSREFLFESVSSIIFHYTRVTTALRILESQKFELSSTLGSVEEQYAPKGYPYFLSTTRTRHGGYHSTIGQDAVLFELDGNYYNQRYPGGSVDYWLNRSPTVDHHRAHEAEDRIFSKKSTMPAAITQMDVYVQRDADPEIRARTRKLLIMAKSKGIPVNFFNDLEAWRMRDTRKLGDVGLLRGQDTRKGYVSTHPGYLNPWIEIIQAKQKNQLSKKANEIRYSLQYTRDSNQIAQGLNTELSNARKPNAGPDRNHAVKIIKYMQSNKLNTVWDLVNHLAEKWKNIES